MKHAHVIAFDPGVTTGWAEFVDGKLVAAGHLSKKALLGGTKPLPTAYEFTQLVIEQPVFYPDGRNKSRPKDLLTLAILAGEIAGLYRRKVEVVEFVTPREWKGSVSKEICHNRMESILTQSEAMPSNHNAKDAVGIGLWKVGRYRR